MEVKKGKSVACRLSADHFEEFSKEAQELGLNHNDYFYLIFKKRKYTEGRFIDFLTDDKMYKKKNTELLILFLLEGLHKIKLVKKRSEKIERIYELVDTYKFRITYFVENSGSYYENPSPYLEFIQNNATPSFFERNEHDFYQKIMEIIGILTEKNRILDVTNRLKRILESWI